MNCYTHPDVAAVGVCTRCGRAGCRDCLEDRGEALVCRRCAEASAAEPIRPDPAAGGDPMNPRDTTGTRARAGWIVGGVSVLAVFVFYLVGMTSAGVPEGEMPFVVVASAVASFLFGYIVWASYWGVPAAWVWWRRVTKAPLDVLASRFRLSGCVLLVLLLFLPATLTLVALYFWIPFLVGIVYGTFGGGVSAYRRDRRSLRLQRAAALFLGVLVHLGCSPDRATERVLYENALDSIDDVLTRTGTTVDAPTSSDGHGSIRIEASAAR